MKKLLPALFLLYLGYFSYGQNSKFVTALADGGLEFKFPENFDTVAIHNNPDMHYELAIKSKTDSFEIRYAINPLKNQIVDHEQIASDTAKNKKASQNIDLNKIFKTIFLTVLINTSLQNNAAQPAIPRFGEFKPEAVKQEFNADWGATSGYIPRPSFAGSYKNCMTVTLHKDNAADVYIFYLFNDKEIIQKNLLPVFHAIKYK